MVNRCAESKKDITKAKIQAICGADGKFSATLDEWSSHGKKKRYLNICLHQKGYSINLGLETIDGSLSAEQLSEMLRNRLASFSIDFDSQIVSIVTDGCSQMTKLGRIVNVDQQLCHAHGANLAVQDTFYKQEKNNNSTIECLILVTSK